MKTKLTSRKFWISAAAFLSSIGTSIAGFNSDNDVIAIAGLICATLSAAIYAGCEAAVDAANQNSGTMNMTTNYYGIDGTVTEKFEEKEAE